MARYNRWQNRSIYRAAGSLSDPQRKEPRGAFFGSIQGTLCHLLFGDQIWLHRFAGTPAPKAKSVKDSASAIESWDELAQARAALDETIINWADAVDPRWLEGDLTWRSGITGRDVTKPRWLLVTHMFNHQTHHRGQVHCLLTQLGAKPDDTDLPFMPA